MAGAGDDLVDGRSGGAVAGPPALSLRRRHSDCVSEFVDENKELSETGLGFVSVDNSCLCVVV